MKLVTFKNKNEETRIGWLKDDGIVDMQATESRLPNDMLTFIDNHETYFKICLVLKKVDHKKWSNVKRFKTSIL